MAANRLAIEARIDDKVSGTLDRMKDKFNQLGKTKGAQQILGGVGVGVGIKALGLLGNVIGDVTDLLGNTLNDASDLAETMSKVNVVFGKSAPVVDEWGKTTARALGLSRQASEEAAASLGNLFTGIGQTQEEAAKMSMSVVTLASDLASFNNVLPTEALDKLRSGLAGESEPLRSMGVFLTEATVKAKALEMGLGDAHGELSEGDKVLARYQLILDQTQTAQGDFSRTAGGLANQQRIVNAELSDASARIGEKLLPAFTKLVGFFADVVIPAVMAVADAVTWLITKIQEAIDWLHTLTKEADEKFIKPDSKLGKFFADNPAPIPIFGHASGGWVGKHGPELALVGEQGPEYVLSQDMLRNGRGPGGRSNLTVNFSTVFPPTREQARMIAQELKGELSALLYFDGSRSSPSAVRK